jgi:hypothetical protein
MKPTMLLYSSSWDNQATFRLMPIEPECPFTEVIFDPASKRLVIFSKDSKDSLHMIPKLDDNGDPMPYKNNKEKYRQQRITIKTYNEYYLSTPEEITNFIKQVATNGSEFDYNKFILPVEVEKKSKIEKK